MGIFWETEIPAWIFPAMCWVKSKPNSFWPSWRTMSLVYSHTKSWEIIFLRSLRILSGTWRHLTHLQPWKDKWRGESFYKMTHFRTSLNGKLQCTTVILKQIYLITMKWLPNWRNGSIEHLHAPEFLCHLLRPPLLNFVQIVTLF